MRKKRRNPAMRRLKAHAPEFMPGTPSDSIQHLASLLLKQSIPEATIFYRVSGRWPDWKGRLGRGLANVRREVEGRGIKVVAEFGEVGSGWRRDDRPAFLAALAEAKARGVPLITATTDRFVRNQRYPKVYWPTVADLEHLVRLADGVTLVTVLIPDALPESCRWYLQNVGQRATGKPIGRPKVNKPGYKKRRRHEKLSRVLRLRERGASYRDIEAVTGVPKSTARDWILKDARRCTGFSHSNIG